MFTHTATSRRNAIAASSVALAALTLGVISFPLPAFAHDTDCPYCKLKVVQDTREQDNEVVLRYGRKRIEYRCVFCALTEANKYKGDLTVLAPSEKKGLPIEILRTGDKWTAPEGTVFVAVKNSHKVCQTTYRAFTTRAAFAAHVQKNQDLLKDAKPLTLAEMLTVAK